MYDRALYEFIILYSIGIVVLSKIGTHSVLILILS